MEEVRDALAYLGIVPDEVVSVGNAELGRHHVVRLSSEGRFLILKILGRKRLEQEVAGLTAAKAAGIAAPDVLSWGMLPAGKPYILMTCLPGEPLAHTQLEEPESLTAYRDMGAMIASLHNLPATCPPDYVERLASKAAGHAAKLQALPLPPEDALLFADVYRRQAALLRQFFVPEEAFGYCHGDFDGRNVLVDAGRVSGLIDFETAYEGNTERDLSMLYRKLFLHPEHLSIRQAFEAGYAQVRPWPTGFHERLPAYLLDDCLENCAWSFTGARDYYDQMVGFLRKMMAAK